MAGFKGFGFETPDELISERNAEFQRAMSSGNPHAMRAASVQQAAYTLFGDPALHKAKQTQDQLQAAFDASESTKTGDEVTDQLNFYKEVQKRAVDTGLVDIALQATEKISSLRLAQEERDRLFSAEERAQRADDRAASAEARFERADERAASLHEYELDKEMADQTKRKLQRRSEIERVGADAYTTARQGGASELEAQVAARRAQKAYYAAETEGGDLKSGAAAAEAEGYDLRPSTFDIERASAMGNKDMSEKLKSLTVIRGEDGQPKIAFVLETPEGTQIEPTDFIDADLAMDMAAADAPGKITDSQRQSVLWASISKEAHLQIEALHNFTDDDFAGVEDALQNILPNTVLKNVDDAQQKYNALQNAWIDSLLRPKSGATIKDEEYDRERKTYFPQAGDSRATVELKRQLRLRATASMQVRGSPALAEYEAQLDELSIEARLARTGL